MYIRNEKIEETSLDKFEKILCKGLRLIMWNEERLQEYHVTRPLDNPASGVNNFPKIFYRPILYMPIL